MDDISILYQAGFRSNFSKKKKINNGRSFGSIKYKFNYIKGHHVHTYYIIMAHNGNPLILFGFSSCHYSAIMTKHPASECIIGQCSANTSESR